MEITTGIHQIKGVRGANCYLVITGSNMLLIDTGMPGNGRKIVNYIKALGKEPSNLDYIILTHADIDHIGSAAEMKTLTGAKLVIHSSDAPVLSGKSSFKTVKGPHGVLFKLLAPLLRLHTVDPDITVSTDFEIADYKIIYTPGHTTGSISLYKPEKVIFVGDALRSDSKGNPKPPSSSFSADIGRAEASLVIISQLKFDILLTGHGAPVIGEASGKVMGMVTHLKLDM
jgi:hydroxyacylglutathione hydrolase